MEAENKIHTLSFGSVVKLDEDVLKVTVNSGSVIEVEQVQEISAAYNHLLGPEKPFYVLTILPNDLNPSKEVRDFWRRPERTRRKLAEAIVLGGTALALIAAFVNKFEKPGHKLNYFKNEGEAMVWLEQQRRSVTT